MISQRVTSLLLILALFLSSFASATDPKPRSIFRCDLKWYLIGTILLGTSIGMGVRYKQWRDRTEITRLKDLPHSLYDYPHWDEKRKFQSLREIKSADFNKSLGRFFEWVQFYEPNVRLRKMAAVIKANKGINNVEEDYDAVNVGLSGTPLPLFSDMATEADLYKALDELISRTKGNLSEEDEERLNRLKDASPFETEIIRVMNLRSVLARTAGSGLTKDGWFKSSLESLGPDDLKLERELRNAYNKNHPYANEMLDAIRRMGPKVIDQVIFTDDVFDESIADAYRKHFSKAEPTLRKHIQKDSHSGAAGSVIGALRILKDIGPPAKPLLEDIRKQSKSGTLSVRGAALSAVGRINPVNPQDIEGINSFLKDALGNVRPGGENAIGVDDFEDFLNMLHDWPRSDREKFVPLLRDHAVHPEQKSLKAAEVLWKLYEDDVSKSPETLEAVTYWGDDWRFRNALYKLARQNFAARDTIAKHLSLYSHVNNSSYFLSDWVNGSPEHRDFLDHPERWSLVQPHHNAKEIKKLGMDVYKAFNAINSIHKDYDGSHYGKEINRLEALAELVPHRDELRQRLWEYALPAITDARAHGNGGGRIPGLIQVLHKIPYHPEMAAALLEKTNEVAKSGGDVAYIDQLKWALKEWEMNKK